MVRIHATAVLSRCSAAVLNALLQVQAALDVTEAKTGVRLVLSAGLAVGGLFAGFKNGRFMVELSGGAHSAAEALAQEARGRRRGCWWCMIVLIDQQKTPSHLHLVTAYHRCVAFLGHLCWRRRYHCIIATDCMHACRPSPGGAAAHYHVQRCSSAGATTHAQDALLWQRLQGAGPTSTSSTRCCRRISSSTQQELHP